MAAAGGARELTQSYVAAPVPARSQLSVGKLRVNILSARWSQLTIINSGAARALLKVARSLSACVRAAAASCLIKKQLDFQVS
jgi:hypothetical protein